MDLLGPGPLSPHEHTKHAVSALHRAAAQRAGTSPSSAVQRHDIIGWESSSDCSTSGHVAYVRSAGCSSESCIRVDQVDGVGGAEELDLEIDEVDGHGDPECIYRLKRQWKARFPNSFGSGAITVSGEADNQAPVDKTSMAWNAWVSVAAVDEQSFNSTLWYFHHWEDAFGDSVSANLNTSLQMGHRDIDAFGSYTAVFERRFPVGFECARSKVLPI